MPYSRSKTITLVTLALVTVLAACGGFVETVAPADEDSSTSSPLGDTEWVLTSLNGQGLIEGTNITLSFDEGSLSGFAGCNAYGGGPDGGEVIATKDGSLTIPGLAITAQFCPSPEGIMEQEQAYVEALSSAVTYRMTDDRLEIGDAAGETTLVLARKKEFLMDPGDLVGTAWLLRSVNSSGLIEGSTITLVFRDDNRIVGVAGCRGYYGTYEASGDDVRFPMLGMIGSVEGCPEALTAQEAEYTTSLEWATDYRLDEGKLEISTARGEVLAFEPLPKDGDASLEGASWTLTAFVETKTIEEMSTPVLSLTDPLAETQITLKFEDGTLSGSAGCNGYGGAYALDGSDLTVGAIAATEMACLDPAGIMEQEQRYLGLLGDVSTHAIFGDRLWLETDDGRGLVFEGIADVSEP
jgi:heat shock protein HslJ